MSPAIEDGPPDAAASRPRRVTIVVPCYNEARRLRLDVFVTFTRQHADIDFVFVNDGSTDETLRLLDNLRQQAPDRFAVVELVHNSGKGEAVRRGIQEAFRGAPHVVGYLDADLSTPLSEIPVLVHELESHPAVEIVIGSRVKLMGRTIRRRAVRHYMGRVFATAVSIVLGIPIYDTQCGAKVFRVSPRTEALFDAPFISRWIFDVEVIARRLDGLNARQRAEAHVLLVEWPLMEWRDVRGSKLRPLDFLVAAIDLARIAAKYRLRRG